MKTLFTFTMLLPSFITAVEAAEEIILTNVEDTYITDTQLFGDTRNINNGTSETLLVGKTEFGNYITYLRFPGLDEFVRNINVITADLFLYRIPGNFSQTYECKVSMVGGGWQENNVTWNNKPTVDNGITTLFYIPPDSNEVTVDVTEIVRSWINGDYPHKGFVLYSTELFPLSLFFGSSEVAKSAFADLAEVPNLKLEYTYSEGAGE